MMTAPATEKEAPIPVEIIAKLRREAGADNDANSAARAIMLEAAAILASRASQEERIREDERDRIYERALRHAAGRMPDAARAAAWLGREEDVMPPPERARLRGAAS